MRRILGLLLLPASLLGQSLPQFTRATPTGGTGLRLADSSLVFCTDSSKVFTRACKFSDILARAVFRPFDSLMVKANSHLRFSSGDTVVGVALWASTQTFASGQLVDSTTGAARAQKLTTARTIGGVSFDGTANITVASATGGFSVTGGALTVTTTSSPQFTVAYDGSNKLTTAVDASGNVTLTATADATLASTGNNSLHVKTNSIERIRFNSNGFRIQIAGVSADASYPIDIQDANPILNLNATTGTNAAFVRIINTGGGFRIGSENSVGGSVLSGAAAYGSFIANDANLPMYLATNGTIRLTITGAGAATFSSSLAITGALSGVTTIASSGIHIFANANTNSTNDMVQMTNSNTGASASVGILLTGTTYTTHLRQYGQGVTKMGFSEIGELFAERSMVYDALRHLFGTGGTEFFRIETDGTVLPGADNTYSLGSTAKRWSEIYLNPAASGVGDVYICLKTDGQVRAGAACAASTELVKTDFAVIDDPLTKTLALRPRSYSFIPSYYHGRSEYGLIAEQANGVDARFALHAEHEDTLTTGRVIHVGDPIGINIPSVLAVTIGAIRQLNDRIVAHDRELATLRIFRDRMCSQYPEVCQ